MLYTNVFQFANFPPLSLTNPTHPPDVEDSEQERNHSSTIPILFGNRIIIGFNILFLHKMELE